MIKLTFLGDVMCKAEMVTAYKTDSGYNFDTIFEKMKDYFNESDYGDSIHPMNLRRAPLNQEYILLRLLIIIALTEGRKELNQL